MISTLRAATACTSALLLVACATPGAGPGAPAAPAAAASVVVRPATAGSGLPAAAASPASGAGAARTGLPSAAAAASGVPPGGPAAGPVPGGPPPFATVIKDAKRIDGVVPLWQKDDKLWIELSPALLNKPLMLSPKIRTGIGQAFIFGGLMASQVNGAGGPQVIEFVRTFTQVQMLARNLEVVAAAGTPRARALDAAYSPSLLGSTTVASQANPDNQAILIEANGLFVGDMLGVGMQLQRAFRQGYSFDPRNSGVAAVRGSDVATIIETRHHFYTASIGSAMPGAPPGAPVPSTPNLLPDTRSLFIGVSYSLAPLPAVPMAVRHADPRVGLFTNTVFDFGNDLARSPRQRFINRWRLEKKDPAAELSEPVKPITFWIDRNVPVEYRGVVREGILEWNKAFEKIGFKNAMVVEQQPDDAPWDTLDYGRASVRWMVNAEPAFGAIGPRHVDPRTGEILDADIAIESISSRNIRSLRTQTLGNGSVALSPALAAPGDPAPAAASGAPPNLAACTIADALGEQLSYALDVLEARGELDADGEQVQQFVLDYLKSTVIHEIGHGLGLRHNFRSSRAFTDAQLSNVAFTREHGVAGSVMDYPAINLARAGETTGVPFQTALGPYDYWAIEYAYRPLAADAEDAALKRIAARNTEPWLAFGTDEDAYLGVDPESLQLDLGSDPLVFAAKRLDIARELFRRQETRRLSPDDDWSVLRRSLSYALNDVARAVSVLMRQIGGVRTLRDFPGSGRDPLEPVDPVLQRRALDLIAHNVLSTEGLSVSPQLQRRLAPDYLDRGDEFDRVPTDYSLPQRLLDLQRYVLNQLMSEGLATRLLDSESKAERPRDVYALADLYQRLDRDVWSELAMRGTVDIAVARRDLQREHLNRIASQLLRPSPVARADARGLLRDQARRLLPRLEAAARRAGDSATRAHLNDSVDTLRSALAAPLLRSGT